VFLVIFAVNSVGSSFFNVNWKADFKYVENKIHKLGSTQIMPSKVGKYLAGSLKISDLIVVTVRFCMIYINN